MKLTTTQQTFVNEATDALQREGWFSLCGYAGSGKAQPIDSIIKTPHGDLKIDDLKIGDEVLGCNGLPTRVIGIFPQGLHDTYCVEFRDGTKTRCNIDHLWNVRSSKDKRFNKPYKTLTLGQIIDTGYIRPSGDMKYQIPLCQPVQYSQKEYYIQPYLLGALIADGTCLGKTPTLCNGDKEIYEKCINLRPTDIEITRCDRSSVSHHRFIYPEIRMENRMNTEFKMLGLDLTSPNRFIPQEYLLGSVDQRMELLRGLMDCDGSSSGNRISYSTKSKKLARDVSSLVQSLGGTAVIREHDRTHHNKGIEYSVNVKMFENPFYFTGKAENWKLSLKNPPSRYIKNIEKIGQDEHVCISVEVDDNLYLTDNFIVTHNTTTLMHLYDRLPEIKFLAPTHKAKGVLKSKLEVLAEVNTTTSFIKSFKGTRLEQIDDRIDMARDRRSTVALLEKRIKGVISKSYMQALENTKKMFTDPNCLKKFKKERKALIKSGDAQQPVFHDDLGRGEKEKDNFIMVVVDESSMVTKRDRDLIIQKADSVIFVGDGFQLPPVTRDDDGKQDWFASRRHDWTFNEVIRQAEGSGILSLATALRQSNSVFDIHKWMQKNKNQYNDLFLTNYCDEMLERLDEDDWVALGFMNDNVDNMCYDVRRVLGRDPSVVTPDDHLFCANNFGDFSNKDQIKLVKELKINQNDPIFGFGCRPVKVINETKDLMGAPLLNDARLIAGIKTKDRKERLSNRGLLARFDYARTVHSSQGSEWDNVVYEHEGVDFYIKLLTQIPNNTNNTNVNQTDHE